MQGGRAAGFASPSCQPIFVPSRRTEPKGKEAGRKGGLRNREQIPLGGQKPVTWDRYLLRRSEGAQAQKPGKVVRR